MKETKTEEMKMRRPFGTKETSGPFPPEACSNKVSLEKNICSYLWFRFPSRLPEENQMRRENRVVNTVYIIISLSTNNDYSIHSLMIPVLCIPAFQTLILSYFLRFFFHLFYHYIFILFLYFFPISMFSIPVFQTDPKSN